MPTSCITEIVSGLTLAAGSVPAELARHPGGAIWLKRPSAIWERALFPIQTKSMRFIATSQQTHQRLITFSVPFREPVGEGKD